jgi:hypothetical protein
MSLLLMLLLLLAGAIRLRNACPVVVHLCDIKAFSQLSVMPAAYCVPW